MDNPLPGFNGSDAIAAPANAWKDWPDYGLSQIKQAVGL
jgi:hypothetical protein